MRDRQDVDFPFVTAGKGFERNEVIAPFDDVLVGIVMMPLFPRFPNIADRFQIQRLVDEGAVDAGVFLLEVEKTAFNLVIHVVRHDGHGDKLAVGVGHAAARRLAEILENQDVPDPPVAVVQKTHTLPIDLKKPGEVGFAHLLEKDSVIGVVDDYLVVAVAFDGLLDAGRQVGGEVVGGQNRERVFDDADIPVVALGSLEVGGGGQGFVAATERAACQMFTVVAVRGRFGLFAGALAAGGGDKDRLGRDNGVDADFPDDFLIHL